MFAQSNENMDPRRQKLMTWKTQQQQLKGAAYAQIGTKPPFVVQKNPEAASFLIKTPLSTLNNNQSQRKINNKGCNLGDKRKVTDSTTPKPSTPLAISHDEICTSPRKDLASIFADEGKTSFLTDMLAEMSVETKAILIASSKKESKRVSFDKTIITSSPSLKRFRVDDAQRTPKKRQQTDSDGQVDVVKDAEYFRHLAETQRSLLEEIGLNWTEILKNTEGLTEDQTGEISLVIGQAHLLCTKKLKQYFGLCDLNGVAKPSDGLTARCADLEGFWDVIMMQVDDVKAMFAKLDKAKENGWAKKEEKCRAPRKKKRGVSMKKSTKSAISRLREGAQPGPVTPRRQAAKARLTAFRQAMRNRKAPVQNNDEEQGMKPMLTPVRATKKEQEEYGSDLIVTSVRRSTRKTPSKYKSTEMDTDVVKMLESSDYSYKPNPALFSQSPQSASHSPSHSHSHLSSALSALQQTTSQLSKYLFDDSEPCDSPMALSTRNKPSSANVGSVKKFVSVTPSAKMRAHLGTDVIFTPVRRSRRLEGESDTGGAAIEEVADLPIDSGYIPNPTLDQF